MTAENITPEVVDTVTDIIGERLENSADRVANRLECVI